MPTIKTGMYKAAASNTKYGLPVRQRLLRDAVVGIVLEGGRAGVVGLAGHVALVIKAVGDATAVIVRDLREMINLTRRNMAEYSGIKGAMYESLDHHRDAQYLLARAGCALSARG
ncbi:MAG TPA: hypothetical protein VNE61_07335, partial [Ktedonobacteraceae bacterium]|nr:hypothetical protein [Ktedonobacteraceae bacterium]